MPPPPPPGLGPVVSKPPPGFTGVPLNSNVVESSMPVDNRLETVICAVIRVHDVGGSGVPCFESLLYFEYMKVDHLLMASNVFNSLRPGITVRV